MVSLGHNFSTRVRIIRQKDFKNRFGERVYVQNVYNVIIVGKSFESGVHLILILSQNHITKKANKFLLFLMTTKLLLITLRLN